MLLKSILSFLFIFFLSLSVLSEGSQTETLLELLKDKDDITREYSVRALGRTNPLSLKVIKALKNSLEDKDLRVRIESARALTNYLLINPPDDIREEVLSILKEAKSQRPKVIDVLTKALRDTNPHVRGDSARALRKIKSKDPKVVVVLTDALLKEKNSSIKEQIIYALKEQTFSTSRGATRALIKALKDENVRVRKASAYVLVFSRPQSSELKEALMEAARESLKDEDPLVREYSEAIVRKHSKAILRHDEVGGLKSKSSSIFQRIKKRLAGYLKNAPLKKAKGK